MGKRRKTSKATSTRTPKGKGQAAAASVEASVEVHLGPSSAREIEAVRRLTSKYERTFAYLEANKERIKAAKGIRCLRPGDMAYKQHKAQALTPVFGHTPGVQVGDVFPD